MDWKDLQYKKPKAIKKKVKQKKSYQVVQAKYPISKTNFSASDWEEYQQWIKQQKKASEPPKEKKVNSTKKKHKKAASKPKKALTRKEEYYQELEHPLWKEKRKVILERDRYQCRICGSKHNLVVHHIKYSEGKKAWQYPNLDLITLCEDCHKKVHQDHKHYLHPKYEEIWYNIDIKGLEDYEATRFGRIRHKDTKKRIQWSHFERGSDDNETTQKILVSGKWVSKSEVLEKLY